MFNFSLKSVLFIYMIIQLHEINVFCSTNNEENREHLLDGPIVNTQYGKIRGKYEKVELNETRSEIMVATYLAIKYARAPIGDLRFSPPVPVDPWHEQEYDATSPRSICMQPAEFAMFPTSEDCLYLNIWQPLNSSRSTSDIPITVRPVFFFIHGTLDIDSGINPKWPGLYLSAIGDFVVVTINYRLSIFGGLYHNKSTNQDNSNLSLRDIIAALDWVKQNINAFGGDPERITIVGHSTGGTRVQALILTPQAKGLFQRAIMLSGINLDLYLRPKSIAYMESVNLAKMLNCLDDDGHPSIDCLRKIPAEKLVLQQYRYAYHQHFVYGDDVLPYQPKVAFQKSAFNQVDLLNSNVDRETNLNEIPHFINRELNVVKEMMKNDRFQFNLTEAHDSIRRIFAPYHFEKESIESIIDLYLDGLNDQSNEERFQLISQVIKSNDDLIYICSSFGYVKQLAASKNRVNHVYDMHISKAPTPHYNEADCFSRTTPRTTCHGDELVYVLGYPLNPHPTYKTNWENVTFSNEQDRETSFHFIRMLSEFVYDGIISSYDGIEWKPTFKDDDVLKSVGSMMVINQTSYFASDSYGKICSEFWKDLIHLNRF